MKIGVICPAEIAFRRFMPAIKKIKGIEYIGVGVGAPEERLNFGKYTQKEQHEILMAGYIKAQEFVNQYGGKIFDGYKSLIESSEIDAVYMPLPPALHYIWAKFALENGKHVLIEKPSTLNLEETKELINIAEQKNLSFHENYMFTFHNQLKDLDNIIASGEIGDVRLSRISFGFPRRATTDFRYDKVLGGGALYDAGGYTLKYAQMLLGDTAKLQTAQVNYVDGIEVDMYGSATLSNDSGETVQVAFGMDNNYKCDLEVWGSRGYLSTMRVFTAPVDYVPYVTIRMGNEEKVMNISADDSFKKSICHFLDCIYDSEKRTKMYGEIYRQAVLVDEFKKIAGID